MSSIRRFEDIPVSTKTFIVWTNISVNIDNMFNRLPTTPYVVIPKRRGRKKKVNMVDPNKDIPDGSIVTIDLANRVRGVLLKKKKKKEGKSTDYFRNSITVVMIVDGKKINFKISRNGKFQMTGCKFDHQAEQCVKHLWEHVKDDPTVYTLSDTHFKAVFIPAMRNIDFNLGFTLDREKVGSYFNNNTDYSSLHEASVGYTGVNIKVAVKKSILDLKLKELTYDNGEWSKPNYIPYQRYLDTLKPKEQQKKLEKERFNTFLVFHSGKTIMSSMCEEFARDVYYEFVTIMEKNKNELKECLAKKEEKEEKDVFVPSSDQLKLFEYINNCRFSEDVTFDGLYNSSPNRWVWWLVAKDNEHSRVLKERLIKELSFNTDLTFDEMMTTRLCRWA